MFIYISLSKQGTQLCRLTILDESVTLDGQISKRVPRTGLQYLDCLPNNSSSQYN